MNPTASSLSTPLSPFFASSLNEKQLPYTKQMVIDMGRKRSLSRSLSLEKSLRKSPKFSYRKPIILAANKDDLSSSDKELDESTVAKFSLESALTFLFTSGKTGHNVNTLFSTVIASIRGYGYIRNHLTPLSLCFVEYTCTASLRALSSFWPQRSRETDGHVKRRPLRRENSNTGWLSPRK